MARFPKQELQVLALAAAVVVTLWVLIVLFTSCSGGPDDDDTDTDCDPRYDECGEMDTDADTDEDTGPDTGAEPGCTEEYTGYDACYCVSPYVCENENYVWWAPGCDVTDDPNDMEAANICCCYEYD
jgi:hypothetical protein